MKSILITGTSSGIGLDVARALKDRYLVITTARDAKDVKALREEGFESFLMDIRCPDLIDKTLEKVLRATNGKIDILFNNAGYGQPSSIEDLKVEVLREQFETNVFGLHHLTRRVIPIMRKNGGGKIIQHSSILGLISLKFRGAYNASKYAVEGLTDTLRLELKGSNIYVSTLNTGPIVSKFRENALQKFNENVDVENSYFSKIYKREVRKRLESKEKESIFTKNSDAVIEKIEHILDSKKPKPRYYITKASSILAFFKRILPTSYLDKILVKI